MLNIVIESKFKHPINIVFNITIIINVGHKHGTICFNCHKKWQVAINQLWLVESKYIFYSMINTKIIFYIIKIKLTNHILNMHSNIYISNPFSCRDVWVSQSRL